MRSLLRSQTYTRPSFAISTHVTSRNDRAGGSSGTYGAGAAPAVFSPYANQWRLYAPESASNTTMRRLPVSATNTSFAAVSTATAAGRLSVVVLAGPDRKR